MNSIFLCHASEDKPFVEKLADDLREYGITVWLDKFEIKVGDSLLEKINEGITESGCFAVILSARSVNKPWVKHELQSAFAKKFKDNKFRIIPILVEECDLPLYLSGLLYADFSTKYEEGFNAVLNVFGLDNLNVCTASNWRLVHKCRRGGDWREHKDQEFKHFITSLFGFCYENRWGIYVGSHKNPYSVAFSAEYKCKEESYHKEYINVRICKDDTYKISFECAYNPNHLKEIDFTLSLGDDIQTAREWVMEKILLLNSQFGKPIQNEGMYVLNRVKTEAEKQQLMENIFNDGYIFDGNFHKTIQELYNIDNDGIRLGKLYL